MIDFMNKLLECDMTDLYHTIEDYFCEYLEKNVKVITPAHYLKEYFNIEVKEDMTLEELYKFMNYYEMDSKPLSVAYWDYPMSEWEEVLMDHIEDGICTLVQIEDRLFEVPRLD